MTVTRKHEKLPTIADTATPSLSCWTSQNPDLCLQEATFELVELGSPAKAEVQNFLLTVSHADSTIVVQANIYFFAFTQSPLLNGGLLLPPGVGGQLATLLYRMGQRSSCKCITRVIVYFLRKHSQ